MASPKEASGQGRPPCWLVEARPRPVVNPKTAERLHQYGIATICEAALCPNLGECSSAGQATFLLMGPACSRNCGFCSVPKGAPAPLDETEPQRVAQAAVELELDYVVLTSTTRDDLPDGGASVFARTLACLQKQLPKVLVEVLVPDFQGDETALDTVLEAGPVVLNHNVETVPALYPTVRPGADFDRSLRLLAQARQLRPDIIVKSGLMVGLGESEAQLCQTFEALAQAGCQIVTIGQYLRPTARQLPVVRYYEPEEYPRLAELGRAAGLEEVLAGPFVRSSWRAKQTFESLARKGHPTC